MKKCSSLDWVVTVLVVVGAINWGLYGVFSLDLVHHFLEKMPDVARGIYVLIGLSGVYKLVKVVQCSSSCKS